ncbi:MAG: hypothetical protein K2X44_09215, partial [Magnetospirillum sp.]|nr:hypothetical protein [Magnetospirillum sp.]
SCTDIFIPPPFTTTMPEKQQGQQIIEGLDLDALMQAMRGPGRNLLVKLESENVNAPFTITIVQDGDIKRGKTSNYGPVEIGQELIRIAEMVNSAASKSIFDEAPILEGDEADADTRHNLQEAMDLVATAGWQLYEFLYACPAFKYLIDCIKTLDPGSRIAISTDRCFLPWNILYPKAFNPKWNNNGSSSAESQLFWGHLYHFETRLLCEIGDQPRQLSDKGKRLVNLNVNPSLEKKLAEGPTPLICTHERFFLNKEYVEKFNKSGSEIQQVLTSKSTEAGLLYFYCHGESEKPYQVGHSERLEFQEGFEHFRPGDIRTDPKFKASPVVFLNSCGSGAFSPLLFNNFHERLKIAGARGMIVTDFSIPIKTGGYIGQIILNEYAERKPIGKSLFELRN